MVCESQKIFKIQKFKNKKVLIATHKNKAFYFSLKNEKKLLNSVITKYKSIFS